MGLLLSGRRGQLCTVLYTIVFVYYKYSNIDFLFEPVYDANRVRRTRRYFVFARYLLQEPIESRIGYNYSHNQSHWGRASFM